MCWNSQVSLNTFLFSTFGALFALFNKYDNKIILLAYSFSFMQFIEYMLWKNLNNTAQNRLWSQIASFNIIIQPFVSINLIKNSNLKMGFFIFYLLQIIAGSLSYDFKSDNVKTTVGKNKHLSWDWLNTNMIGLAIWSFFFFAPLFIEKYYVFGFIGIITLLSSLYFYDQKTFGSMWCWSANMVWIIIIAQSSGLFSKGCLY